MITYNYKQILKVSAPLILGMLIQVLVGVTDTAFLGRVGEVELGASAIASLVYLIIFMLVQSLAAGAQIIMARRNGEKRYIRIGSIFYQTLNILFLISIISIVLVFWVAPKILADLIQSDNILTATLLYLFPRIWGLFFSSGKAVMRAFFVAITNTKQLIPAAIILLVSNFVFDYWLIFGGLGIRPLGIAGAAIASCLAEACALAYLVGYIIIKMNLPKYGFDRFVWWKQELFREILHLSSWIAIQNLLSWGTWFYFFIEVEKLGEQALAISNILRSASTMPFIFANALAMVVSSMVSNLIGAAKDKEVIPTVWRVLKFGAAPYYLSFLIMMAAPEMFLRMYTNNQSVIENAVLPFYTMLLTYLIALPAMIYFYCIFGTGKAKAALVVEILCSVMYVLTVRFVVGMLKLDLAWCWMSELPYYTIMFVVSYWYIKRNKWCCEIV